MKRKIFIILSLFIIMININAQSTIRKSGSINISSISGKDSTFFIKTGNFSNGIIEFEYTTLNQDDATLEVGTSKNGKTFTPYPQYDTPFLLNVTANRDTINGVVSATHVCLILLGRGEYKAFRITPNSVTTGLINYELNY